MSRRDFIRKAVMGAAGVLAPGTMSALSGCAPCPKRIDVPNRAERILADLHVHATLNEWLKKSPVAVGLKENVPFAEDVVIKQFNPTGVTWQTSHQAGVDMMCVAHFNPFDEFLTMPTDPNPDAPRQTRRMMDLLELELEANKRYATLARTPDELRRMVFTDKDRDWQQFRIAVVHVLEGGHALGGSIAPLRQFSERGVAMIGITHFFNKVIASSANSIPYFPDANSLRTEQGLSEFGEEVVRQMEALGIIVDATHATATTIEHVLKFARKPVISSHSAARTLGDHPYALFDEHIQQIADNNGIVGIILMPYWLSNFSNTDLSSHQGSLDDVVRTIRYVYKICGNRHEHIGIGTDFAGFIPAPRDIECHGRIYLLRDKLMDEFDHDKEIVDDILANNVINFFLKYWKSGA